jgi:dTMP kinase
MAERGRLITFEGGEGAGKTTQIGHLARALRAAGLDPLTTREPGGTEGAEAIRQLLLAGAVDRWTPLGEALLHMAARQDHLARLVAPALAAGRWVLCDRFADSTRVYQGIAGGLGLERVDRLHREAFGEWRPDLTLVLDLPVEVGLARRRAARGGNRYERRDTGFHEQVREGFLRIAAAEPGRCVVIDAAAAEAEVAHAIQAVVAARLGALPAARAER